MAQMTRGEMQDLLAKFAASNPQYRSALIQHPRQVVEKQFNMSLPSNLKVKTVEETADTIYVVVPHVPKAGAELDDADLEKVAGGGDIKMHDANCQSSPGAMNTVIDINASLF